MGKSLEGLHPFVKAKTEQLLVNANGRLNAYKMVITQALRTKDEQDALYAIGRNGDKRPKVTNARGGYSMHNFGLAVDIALVSPDGKKYVWDTKSDFDGDKKADWMEVVEEAKKLGFEWGGDWRSFKDYPHFQMTAGLSDHEVYSGIKPKFPTDTKPTPAPAPEAPAFPAFPGHTILKGDKGVNVERIQRAVGMNEKDVDGKYGDTTIRYVKAYQRKHGLVSDGQVGPKTWGVMF